MGGGALITFIQIQRSCLVLAGLLLGAGIAVCDEHLWLSDSLLAQGFGGGASAYEVSWNALTGNPASLTWLRVREQEVIALRLTSDRDALRAFDYYALEDNSWSAYFAATPGGEAELMADDLRRHAGRWHEVFTRLTLIREVKPGQAWDLSLGLAKGIGQERAEDDEPAPRFHSYHRSDAMLRLAFSRQLGAPLGGPLAVGFSGAFGAIQRRLDVIEDAGEYKRYVTNGWYRLYHDDPEFSLRFGTRLGFLWQVPQRLGTYYRPNLALVGVNPIGSDGGDEWPLLAQFGLALVPLHRGLPGLFVDLGSYTDERGRIHSGGGAGLHGSLGPLQIALSTGPTGKRSAFGLHLPGLVLEYLWRQEKDISSTVLETRSPQTIRFAFVSRGDRPQVPGRENWR
jgi:hypothetical protein